MPKNIHILAVGVVLAAVVPAYAGGGKGGSNHSNGNNHQNGHHNNVNVHRGQHGHYYYSGYYYWGGWPYAYYYDYGPTFVGPLPTDIPPAVATETEEREEPQATPATVQVRTAAAAKMWFDGAVTSQTGEVRTFSTPPLEQGREYSYTLRAVWMDDGRPVVRSRTVSVAPGKMAIVDLR